MGEIFICGTGASHTLQDLIPRDVEQFKNYHCYYTHICNRQGIIMDDCLVYKFNEKYFLIVLNSSGYNFIYDWIVENKLGNTEVKNISNETAKLDIQGPKSNILVNRFLDSINENIDNMKFYTFQRYNWHDSKIIISRTGYTGELGYELYAQADKITKIWDKLFELGKGLNVIPAGLGARDSLRLEAGLPLVAKDMPDITPIEAGFEKYVSRDKENFFGKQALLNQIDSKDRKYRCAVIIEKGGIARQNHEIFDKAKHLIGKVTSGTFSPTLKQAIGLGLCGREPKTGEEIFIKIRDQLVDAKICETPFIKKNEEKHNV
jgi:aminomethyltransferase